jgi:hypothetical protein
MRIAALALIGAVAVSVGLAGCTPATAPTVTPTPKATAVFTSDADALKAAEKAYAAYLAASNEIAKSGWKSVDAYSDYETGDALRGDRSSASKFLKRGLRQIGESKFDSMHLEQVSKGALTLQTYLCLDVSGVDVIDSSGASVVPAERVSRNPLEVTFISNARGELKISDSQSWLGSNFC